MRFHFGISTDQISPESAEFYFEILEREREREDRRFAQMAWAVFATTGTKIQGRQATIEDFMPAKPKPEPTEEEKEASFAVLFEMLKCRK